LQLLIPGEKNAVSNPIIDPKKFYLPPMHIKLALINNFIKAMDQNRAGFMNLKNRFPRISDAEMKEGPFVGPQIRELI
jgi:hypothetical protein